jgi:aspartate 1-decarboxylase
MLTKLLKAKLHRAVVTFTDVDYHGSITIDSDLLARSGLLPNEAVVIADCENGSRFETYIIPGEPGSGMIGINGAAARLTAVGHRVIIMSYVMATEAEVATHRSRVVLLDDHNRPTDVIEHATVKGSDGATKGRSDGGKKSDEGGNGPTTASSSLRRSVAPSLP